MTETTLLPELARDSHLITRMTPDFCVHFFAETPTTTRKEIWKRKKRIGAGGFGTVWLETCIDGQESGNDTLRAVKVLRLPSDAQAHEAIAQCGRELETLAKFSQRKYSRCFVKSYGWYEHASSIAICLEYLPLGDLQAYIAERADPKLPESETQQIISQILDGLVFMHAEGFAHRDLKPSNVLIKSHGPDNWWVKLSDFGLSKRTEVTRGATTLQGTPGFMAPELWGFLASDDQSRTGMWCSADLWCTGEIAFQLVTSRATFPNPGTLAQYALKKCEFPVSELQKATVSSAMVDFVTAVMLADHTKRPTAEAASAHRWLRELKTASLVLPSSVRLDPGQGLSSGESSVLDHTASDIDYRDWSTVTSAPAISPRDRSDVNPARLSWGGPVDAAKAVPDSIVRPPQSALNQGQTRAAITQIPILSSINLSDSTSSLGSPARSIIALSIDSNEQESESDLAASAQKSLAAGTKWYSDAPNIRNANSSNSVDKAYESRQLTAKVLTTATIDELTTSSASILAQATLVASFKGTQPGTHQLIFSPDSMALATTSDDSHVDLWRMEKRILVRTIESVGKYAAFSPDSRQIATVKEAGAGCIMDASLERLDEGPQARLRGHAEDARCVAFSPAGNQLVVGTSKGTIVVWDTIGAKMLKKVKAHSSAVLWVAYYPRPQRDETYHIVGAEADGWFRFWKHESHSILPDRLVTVEKWGAKGMDKTGLSVQGRISAAAASKSFARLAVAALDGSITVWYTGSGDHWIEGLDRESVLSGHKECIDVMDFSPDSKLLASASRGSIKIWQVRGGLPVATIRAPVGGIPRSVAFSPDSASLASTSSDGVVCLWDAERVQNLSDVQDHLDRASFIAVSPDRRYMVSVSRELRSKELVDEDSVWQSSRSQRLVQQRLPVDTDTATLVIWDVVRAKPLTMMSGYEAEILSVSFSEDSRRLGSISADHDLRIWDVETGRCLDTIASRTSGSDAMPCAALSPNLRYCAAVFRYHFEQKITYRLGAHSYKTHSGFAISLCDIRLGAQPSADPHPCKALTGTAMDDDILAVTFSPDATKLAAVDQNDNVTLWDTASGIMTARLSDFTQPPPRGRKPFQPEWRSARHFTNYRAHMRDVDNPALHFDSSGTRLAMFSGLSVARFWKLEGGGAQLLRRIGSSSNTKPSKRKNRRRRDSESGGKTSKSENSSGAFAYCSYSIPLAVSPDGTRCVVAQSAAGQQPTLWDVGTGESVATLTEHSHSSDLCHVSFSPDSRWLVTASDKDMVVRDAATGRKFTEITVGVSWPLRMVVFWSDSRYIVSGCHKGMLQFWDVESGAMVKAFEGHTGRRSLVL